MRNGTANQGSATGNNDASPKRPVRAKQEYLDRPYKATINLELFGGADSWNFLVRPYVSAPTRGHKPMGVLGGSAPHTPPPHVYFNDQ